MWTSKGGGGFQIVHISPQGGGGSRGWSMWTFFCFKIPLFQKWFRKKIFCITIFKKIEEKKLFFINYWWFCYKKISKRGGVSEKSTWLARGGQPKVHVRSTRGRGGQKVLKIGPHGLWTTPYLKYFLFDCRKNILISLSMPQKSNFISIKTKIFSLSLRVSVSWVSSHCFCFETWGFFQGFFSR